MFNPYQDEFDSVLEAYDQFPDTRDNLSIRDEQEVNKYMRIVQRLDSEYDSLAKSKKEEVGRLELFYDSELAKIDEKRKFFEMLITSYYSYQREKNPSYKLKTPWGKVTQRKTKSPAWEDEAATLDWLKKTNRIDLVKVEESLRKAELKKAFVMADGHYIDESTGEIVPGVTVEEKTTIKVSTTEGAPNGES